jgi:hypothetical protein
MCLESWTFKMSGQNLGFPFRTLRFCSHESPRFSALVVHHFVHQVYGVMAFGLEWFKIPTRFRCREGLQEVSCGG